MNKKIEQVCLMSVLKVMPIIYGIVGFVVAVISYVYSKINPDIAVPRLGFGEWILAILLYSAVFCLIFTAVTVLSVWLYNLLNKKVGAIKVSLAD